MRQKSAKSKKLSKLRQKLVLENQRLVYFIVNRLLPKDRPHRNQIGTGIWEDAIQAGMLGLTNAAILFKPKMGNKFCTYAYWAIKNEVSTELAKRHLIHIPYYKEGSGRKEQFAQDRDAAMKVRSLDMPISGGSDGRDWIEDRKPQPEYNDNHDEICKQVKQLPDRHRQVVQHRFWDGMPYKDIGKKLGVSTERARQIANAAIKTLRRRLPHLAEHFQTET